MDNSPTIGWQDADRPCSARWHSESGLPPPRRVLLADDTLAADAAFRLVSAGTALLWRGDFHNARQLLQAMARRAGRRQKPAKAAPGGTPAEAFHRHRMAQAQRARSLGMLLIPVEAGHRIPLHRAPDVTAACAAAGIDAATPFVISLRELQGLIGAHEWRKKGVPIPALGASIHPHYGVFSPVRGEYIDLVAQAPLPAAGPAFDIGTGTGVLAAVLARRGVGHIVATDQDPRALACARDNLDRLGLADKVELLQADLFPPGRAPLIVCNPPWLPGAASSPIERAVYDPDSRMLRGFLAGLREHLAPGGEGWLILSDLAEHLGLRRREELPALVAAAGLVVIDRLDTRPHHPKATDANDPLHAARAQEVTSLWRLAAA